MFAGFPGTAFTQSQGLLRFCAFLIGFGGGAVNGATNALVADISDKYKGANLSLLGVFFGIGALGMPLVLGILKDNVLIRKAAEAKGKKTRHSSGKTIFDLADIVVDTCAPLQDASVNLKNHVDKIGPVSSMAFITCVWMTITTVAEILADRGVSCISTLHIMYRVTEMKDNALMKRWLSIKAGLQEYRKRVFQC
jgi:hypothetical protein